MPSNAQEMRRMVSQVESFVVAGAVNFMQGVIELNNEGGEGAPAAPKDTGELRSSPRVTVNEPSREESSGPGPLLTSAEVARSVQLGGFDIGDILYATWLARHANIIEGGRRLGRHGKMLGSEQAPKGWVWPAIETQMSRQDRWRFRGGRP